MARNSGENRTDLNRSFLQNSFQKCQIKSPSDNNGSGTFKNIFSINESASTPSKQWWGVQVASLFKKRKKVSVHALLSFPTKQQQYFFSILLCLVVMKPHFRQQKNGNSDHLDHKIRFKTNIESLPAWAKRKGSTVTLHCPFASSCSDYWALLWPVLRPANMKKGSPGTQVCDTGSRRQCKKSREWGNKKKEQISTDLFCKSVSKRVRSNQRAISIGQEHIKICFQET